MSVYQIFPASIPFAFPFTRRAKHSTIKTQFENGVEQTRARWHRERKEYDLVFDKLTESEMSALWDFFNARQGGAEPFLFNDPQVAVIEGEAVGSGDSATVTFALDNKYIDSASLIVKLDGAPTSAYTLDDDAGLITFDVAPAAGVAITADYSRYILVRFEDDLPEEQAAYRIYNSNLKLREVFT